MATPRLPAPVEQGRGGERLPLPSTEHMDAAQSAAAHTLIVGPRQARVRAVRALDAHAGTDRSRGQLGEAQRFGGQLPAAVRELTIVVVAQHVGNQFEWVMHVPLAQAAGIPAPALEAIRLGQGPQRLSEGAGTAHEFCVALLSRHAVDDACYQRACAAFGEAGVVELSTLVGLFRNGVMADERGAHTRAPDRRGTAAAMIHTALRFSILRPARSASLVRQLCGAQWVMTQAGRASSVINPSATLTY